MVGPPPTGPNVVLPDCEIELVYSVPSGASSMNTCAAASLGSPGFLREKYVPSA